MASVQAMTIYLVGSPRGSGQVLAPVPSGKTLNKAGGAQAKQRTLQGSDWDQGRGEVAAGTYEQADAKKSGAVPKHPQQRVFSLLFIFLSL